MIKLQELNRHDNGWTATFTDRHDMEFTIESMKGEYYVTDVKDTDIEDLNQAVELIKKGVIEL
jgi:hypothetical protein